MISLISIDMPFLNLVPSNNYPVTQVEISQPFLHMTPVTEDNAAAVARCFINEALSMSGRRHDRSSASSGPSPKLSNVGPEMQSNRVASTKVPFHDFARIPPQTSPFTPTKKEIPKQKLLVKGPGALWVRS